MYRFRELQADMQMALAMSLSLQQENKIAENEQLFYLEAFTVQEESIERRMLRSLENGVSHANLQKIPTNNRKGKK